MSVGKKTRVVTISVCLPVSCTVEVSEDNGDDLIITAVRRVDCSPSVRSINEAMGDDEFDAMRVAFNKAKP